MTESRNINKLCRSKPCPVNPKTFLRASKEETSFKSKYLEIKSSLLLTIAVAKVEYFFFRSGDKELSFIESNIIQIEVITSA